MNVEMFGFHRKNYFRSITLESLLQEFFEAKINVISCIITEYKPVYKSFGNLTASFASKAVIMCKTHTTADADKIAELRKLM